MNERNLILPGNPRYQPKEIYRLLSQLENYTGKAEEKAREIVSSARHWISY